MNSLAMVGGLDNFVVPRYMKFPVDSSLFCGIMCAPTPSRTDWGTEVEQAASASFFDRRPTIAADVALSPTVQAIAVN